MDVSQVNAVAPNKEELLVRMHLDSTKLLGSTTCTGMKHSLECCDDAHMNDAKGEEVCSVSDALNHSPNAIQNQLYMHQSGIQPRSQEYTVKVKQLSGMVTDDELRRVFSYYGEVQSLRINEVPEPYNYAYVNYTSQEAAKKAVKNLNGKKLYGTNIRVIHHRTSATKVHRRPHFDSSRSRRKEQHMVIVKHIPGWVTDDILQRFFLSHSYQTNVELVVTSQPFNHAIVTFDCFKDALSAVEQLSEKVIQIDHHDVQLFLNIDGRFTKHRKFDHTYDEPQKSLEEIKLHTGGDSISDMEKKIASQVTSPNVAVYDEEDKLLNVIRPAAVKDDEKISSQNNSIVTTETPQQACDSSVFPLLNTTDSNTASHKDVVSREINEERSVPCTPLVARILLAHCAGDMKKLQNAVSIQPNISYSALIVAGTAVNIKLIEDELNELLKNVQTCVVKKIVTLPCHYLPLLSNTALKPKVGKIEVNHAVRFKVANEDNKTFSVEQCFKKMRSMIKGQKDALEAQKLSLFLNGHVPAVQCIGAQCHAWLWENDVLGYTKYPSHISEELTKQFLLSNQVPFNLMIQSNAYTINLSSMKQINARTGYQRTIQHEIKHTDLCDINPERCKHKPSHRLCIEVEGHERHLESAISDLKSCMEKYIHEQSVKVNMKNSTILNLTDPYCIDAQIVEGNLVLRGAEEYVSKVIIQIQNACITHLESTSSPFSRPSHWEHQSEKVLLCPVGNGTQEWNDVAALMHKTLPTAVISKLERIQNEWLWKRYSFAKQRMIEKNGQDKLNERQLFHGTKSTTPDKIYQSEQGFDFRCSGETNMWGAGTYFAVNASYSNSYSYSLTQNDKQMFLADVLTGVAYKCQPDGTLKKPPQNHDSVTGHTNGSDIFVIYDLDQSYPEYLITYRST